MAKYNVSDEKLYGKFRAEVKNINDPLKRGRIEVKCESLMPNASSLGWAESCFMPGTFNLPRKGDFVWIEFEEGDIDHPIWVGIMPTRKYVKEYLFEGYSDRVNYDHLISVFRTSHFKVNFKNNDLKGNEQLVIEDKAGTKVTFDTDNGSLLIDSNNDFLVTYNGEQKSTKGSGTPYKNKPSAKEVTKMEME